MSILTNPKPQALPPVDRMGGYQLVKLRRKTEKSFCGMSCVPDSLQKHSSFHKSMKSLSILMFIISATVAFPGIRSTKMTNNQRLPDTTVYMIVQVPPKFPGGTEALFRFIQSTSKYPVSVKKGPLVQLRLLVEKDGSISAIKTIYTDADVRFVQEAERIAKAMPTWIPGSQDGRLLRSYAVIPIRFIDRKK